MFEIPADLAPEIYPLAWLVGRWEGAGRIAYPAIPEFSAWHELEFSHDGGPYLAYRSTIWTQAADGTPETIWTTESGYWRISPLPPEGYTVPAGGHSVEVVLADAAGSVSLYVGVVHNGRIDLATDLMARSASAPEVAGATRLYGLVEQRLLWAWDLAAFGQELQSYASFELDRRPPAPAS